MTIVSDTFEGVALIDRHRLVQEILADDMEGAGGGVHALSIKAKTVKQWERMQEKK